MSMKPGATTWPCASIVRVRVLAARLPISAIFPPRMPISPEYQGEPVPSIMRPLVITMSKRSEEHTSELQSHSDLVCRLLLEKKKKKKKKKITHEKNHNSDDT